MLRASVTVKGGGLPLGTEDILEFFECHGGIGSASMKCGRVYLRRGEDYLMAHFGPQKVWIFDIRRGGRWVTSISGDLDGAVNKFLEG